MDKFDEIQQMWNQLNSRLDRLEPSLVDQSRLVAEKNIASARGRLLRRDRRMIYLSVFCAFIFPVYFAMVPTEFGGFVAFNHGYWRLICVFSFLIYFLTAVVLQVRKYLMEQEINVGSMSIEEISRRAREIKRFHLRAEVIMTIMGIIVLTLFFWMLSIGDRWLMIGGMIGGVIGLAIALPMFFRYLADYRAMIYPYDD